MANMCATGTGGGGAPKEFMLFGVRVVIDSMRKSVSLNNLSQYESSGSNNNNDNNKDDLVASGYASADDAVHRASRSRSERRRGLPWSEEEHKLFLLGLQTVGKGDWKGIARNFVKTRTPTQVASHAQKYFLRQNNLNRRRRRSSVFDITTDTVPGTSMEEASSEAHPVLPPPPESNNIRPMLPLPSETSNINNCPAQAFPRTSNLVGSSSSRVISASFNKGDNIIILA